MKIIVKRHGSQMNENELTIDLSLSNLCEECISRTHVKCANEWIKR